MSVNASSATLSRVANLVIVGVSRGGTTSLFQYLGQHPDIGTADYKELRYFTPLRYGEQPAPVEAYAAHFRHCTERFAVEATPGYFYGGRPLARALRETCPGVRAIVSLREPADRCWSWYQFVKSRTRIPRHMTFDAYLDRCEELREAGVDGALEHQAFWGLGGGCYSVWLDDWIEEFGDGLQILFFDDVTSDPAGTIAAICARLGLDERAMGSAFEVNNKAEPYRLRRLQRVALSFNRRGERFLRKHPTTKRVLRRAYYWVNKAPAEPEMSESARARLTAFYQPYNARLAEQLAGVGLELPSSWSQGQQ